MAIPSHKRVTFTGVYGSATAPVEQFSFHLKKTGGLNNPETNTSLVAEANAYLGYYQARLAGFYRPAVVVTKVRVAMVDNLGRVKKNADGSYFQGDSTAAAVPGTLTTTSGVLYPPQLALVVSLENTNAGPHGKNRFFLPAPTNAISNTDLRLDAPYSLSVATAVKNLITDMNLQPGSVMVMGSDGFAGAAVRVKVGRVLDTQRSRRNALPEAYEVATF